MANRKNMYCILFKRIKCFLLSLFLVGETFPLSAFAFNGSSEQAPQDFNWDGFEEFSSAVNSLLSETSEANSYASSIVLDISSGTMAVNGENCPDNSEEDFTHVTKDDIIMLPISTLADHVNATVVYDSSTNEATVYTEEKQIVFTQGKDTAALYSDDFASEMYMPLYAEPELIDNELYVPLNSMADFLGYDAEIVDEKIFLSRPYQTKRLIVKSTEEYMETYGAVQEISGFQDLHILQYETEEAAREAHKMFMLTDTVEYAEPDCVISVTEAHKSWGTNYVGADTYNQYLQTATPLSEEVVVAVVDTGVDSSHEFLAERVIPVNKNFVDSTPNSNDKHSHGTHVAGIIADMTLPNVKILPVKVLDNAGRGTALSVYNGIMFAIQQKCSIINMSLGGYGKSELHEEAIKAAVAENIVVVVAAGNDGIDASMETPSRVVEAITVGAITSAGNRASYSNYGAIIDIWAPGSNILSSVPGNKYEEKSGTSMAAPHVAAAAAMLKTYNSSLSPRQIETIFQEFGATKRVSNIGGTTKVLSVVDFKNLSAANIQDVVATPTVSLAGGYYQESKILSISCQTPGAEIRYTTDGTVPTAGTGTVYTGPISLQSSAWLNVRAFKTGCIDSYSVERVYYISDYPESFHDRTYNYYDTWTYVCPDQNAKYLKITFDENTYIPFPLPWEGETAHSNEYFDAQERKYGLYLYDGRGRSVNNEYADIERDYFIYDELADNSVIVSGNRFSLLLNCPLTENDYGFRIKRVEPIYEERLSAPVFVTPSENKYAQRVEYSNFMLIGTSVIHYAENKTVTLRGPDGAEIYYTLDGSLPTRDSLRYTGPIPLDEPKKIRAKAFRDGYLESEAVSETYYASHYPESLHGQRRDYIFYNDWQWQAPSDVKYIAVTFDEKTDLGKSGIHNPMELTINNGVRGFVTSFYGSELAGRTLYIKGNSFSLRCGGNVTEGIECPYGFKIADIQYYYNEDDIIPIENIKITGPTYVTVGKQVQMTATVTPANANTGFFWRIWNSSPEEATVDENGVVTGRAVGQTRVLATSNFVNSIATPGGSTNPDYPSYGYNGSYQNFTVKEEPPLSGSVQYSTRFPTNQDVTATVTPSESSAWVVNNGGSPSYTFRSNGQFTFQLKTPEGKTGTVTAKVDWIDKTPPTAELRCSPETVTNGDVVVTMIPSEMVTVTSPMNGSTDLTLTKNGMARFEFVDRAGNTGFVEREVTWIDKSEISASISYQTLENGSIRAVLSATKPVTVLNNGGSTEYIFAQNGDFTFEFQYDGDKLGCATASVYWITTPDFCIDSVDDLLALKKQCDRGKLSEGTLVRLEADLDMGDILWEPMGNASYPFNGIFEGNGHTISHLTIDEDSHYVGLFQNTSPYAVIRNLRLENISVTGPSVGGIVWKNEGYIVNCTVSGSLQNESSYAGGIAAYNHGVILNCHVRGNLIQTQNVLGYTGYLGGIAGYNEGKIVCCSMAGTISSDPQTLARVYALGGIAGVNAGGDITSCYTQGTISTPLENVTQGGIVAQENASPSAAEVSNCYSTMKIQGDKAKAGGGIAGSAAFASLTIRNCVALNETITANSGRGRVAGDVTGDTGATLDNNYAFFGMMLGTEGSAAPVEDDPGSPLTHFNGKGVSPKTIRTKEFWEAAGFSFGEGGWIWQKDKMPCLREDMAFDWPQWLSLDHLPAPTVGKAPEANSGLVYTGKAQELIAGGEVEGGTFLYRLGESGAFGQEIPTGTDAGTYTVWYQVIGDEDHTDLSPVSLPAVIRKAARPENIPQDITVPAGTTLSLLTLPNGWFWKNPGQVLSPGPNNVAIVYSDTRNYEQTEFTITVTVEHENLSYEITNLDPVRIPETGFLEIQPNSSLADIYDSLPIHSTLAFLAGSDGTASSREITFQLRDEDNPEYVAAEGKTYLLKACFPALPENISNPKALYVTIAVRVASDQTPPTASVTYSPHTLTNQDVVATITSSEKITVTNNGGSLSHTFVEDGSFTFTFENEKKTPGSVTATVNWIDKEPPLITLQGNGTQILQVGGSYVELGAKVTDNKDPDIQAKLSIDPSAVNMGKAGSYAVKYSVTDAAGNYTEVFRTVTVAETTPPPTPSGKPDSPNPSTPDPIIPNEPEEPPSVIVSDSEVNVPTVFEKLPFTDVKVNSWYYTAVNQMYQEGLMGGTTQTTFSPSIPASRAMLVTILYRLEGEPTITDPTSFPDVKAKWCAPAIAWASRHEIVLGYADGNFGPNDEITREQVAVILFRYARQKGWDTTARGNLSQYSDSEKVHKYAREAMEWAVGTGLIGGRTQDWLAPRETTTRAELAVMLTRFETQNSD